MNGENEASAAFLMLTYLESRNTFIKGSRGRTRYFQREGKQRMQETRRCPMRTLFYLSESQLERIKAFFPRSHGAPRVDDRRVVSGIIYVIKHGLQ